MKNIFKKNIIKVPTDIKVILCEAKKEILFLGPKGLVLFKFKNKLTINFKNKTISVKSQSCHNNISKIEKKHLKTSQGTTISLLKQAIKNISTCFYKKLIIVGVGYKAFVLNMPNNTKILQLKVGYSHPIYIKIPNTISIYIVKSTKIFISGTSLTSVSQLTSKIRSYKKPEPYKGKGIKYANETINLKEGKKI